MELNITQDSQLINLESNKVGVVTFANFFKYINLNHYRKIIKNQKNINAQILVNFERA